MQAESAPKDVKSMVDAIHNEYNKKQPFSLELYTSIAVNSWRSELADGTPVIDRHMIASAWDLARRRCENSCIVLGHLHPSSASLLGHVCRAIPFTRPIDEFESFHRGIDLIRSFVQRVTPENPFASQYSFLGVSIDARRDGELVGLNFRLGHDALNLQSGLLDVPTEPGNRMIDAFYYLHRQDASDNELGAMGLMPRDHYHLFNRLQSDKLPSYIGQDEQEKLERFRKNLEYFDIPMKLLVVLSTILMLGNGLDPNPKQSMTDLFTDASDILAFSDHDPEVLIQLCTSNSLDAVIATLYTKLVQQVISTVNARINDDIAKFASAPIPPIISPEDSNFVNLTVLDVASTVLSQAVSFKLVFDDNYGVNEEIVGDGIPLPLSSGYVLQQMEEANNLVAFDTSSTLAGAYTCDPERARAIQTRQTMVERVLGNLTREQKADTYIAELFSANADECRIADIVEASRVWFHLSFAPTNQPETVMANARPWSPELAFSQVVGWSFVDWGLRKDPSANFIAEFSLPDFLSFFAPLGLPAIDINDPAVDDIKSWAQNRGWDVSGLRFGHERIWMSPSVWQQSQLELDVVGTMGAPYDNPFSEKFYGSPFGDVGATINSSRDDLMKQSYEMSLNPSGTQVGLVGDYGLGTKGDHFKGVTYHEGDGAEKVETETNTFGRRVWVAVTWALTFWIPSFLLSSIGRMKRPDVRQAWREKVALVMIIILINGIIVFFIIVFGRLLCPSYDKAWNRKEVATHQGRDDFWVSHAGKVYDLSKFWRQNHGAAGIRTTQDQMEAFGGVDVTGYIRPPLRLACGDLTSDQTLRLLPNNTLENPTGEHSSGTFFQPNPRSAMRSNTWYTDRFLPRMNEMYKGDLVWTRKEIEKDGDSFNRPWVIIDKSVYDLSDYFHTLDTFNDADPRYEFIDPDVRRLVTENPGGDITKLWNEQLNSTTRTTNMRCLNNYFYQGKLDFRKSAQCTVGANIMLALAIVLCVVIAVKFLAALQLGTKRRPSPQDKFVICQVPAYTEGEDQLRKSLESLTALEYDNKRKLILVVCDGVLIGAGNDRPTPKIVLDILGVDPQISPPALPFYSIGNDNEKLNYGKVYSGLFEYEGNVVPYLVVVKVGKESEQSQSKPGNRGKRDSQILLMKFLNRVHFRSPMNPLELEMYHQLSNVIGVNPDLYEYLLMVDADTMVLEDSLNRLVASCAMDTKIAGICGETSLQNEERSWWTMIQVYEYYISHHLSKAFESLFGSVTCLPGCFTMYRLRTADKGKPLIVSDAVISEYEDAQVDTLHKKNLLSLGEDRYLTTLMTKHFPNMSYKFVPDAYALTAAPETWSVLLSQRRRWINSTIHNLMELMFLKNMCGFCCFSMRFIVFIDLFGTVILPSTCVYLVYLIYTVAAGKGPIPYISIIMLAAVYGLQAIIFILKRQWQHIGWMIIYILAYPIFSFILPMYSFWKQDDFSWGNTRRVIEEKGKKTVITTEEKFDPRSIPLQTWSDYAALNGLPNAQAPEMMGYDDMKSQYSPSRPSQFFDGNATPPGGNGRHSMLSHFSQNPHQNHR